MKILLFKTNFQKRFASLSKAGKAIVTCQLLIFVLLIGTSTKNIVNIATSSSSSRRSGITRIMNRKAVEVPYSAFMDAVEGAKQPDAQYKVDRVIIGKERIGFLVGQEQETKTTTNEKSTKSSTTTNKSNKASSTGSSTQLSSSSSSSSSSSTQQDQQQKQQPTLQYRSFYTRKINASPDLVSFLRTNDMSFASASTRSTDLMASIARSSVLVIYLLFLIRMYRTMNGGGGAGGGGRNGDNPGKIANGRNQENNVKFEDVEGIDSAKYEVMELVDTLRNPTKYKILGARAPTGLLLEGPPGTGKTMLAKACATSAGVPLLYCSGSDFVEMFVGRGAARVRKTFAKASKLAPCIIFIDELDALGKSRSAGEMMGMNLRSNDEAEQTLNQLLACMDGLDSTRGICVLAATNRRDVLDPALVRPGRFDRLIKMELPNADGRERILRVHAKKLPGFTEGSGIDDKRIGSLGRGKMVDLSAVAAVTQGLAGAELECIVNEAAIRAVRRVSAKLREDPNVDPSTIDSAVNAMDFEDSVRNFYDTRRPRNAVSDVLSNVLRPNVN